MSVRSEARTTWSPPLAEPQIDGTAYVHSFSNVIGDVRVGANVLIAPGTSIRADEGTPFRIGQGANVQDGVVIHGLEQGQVLGDDGDRYSVWIGQNTVITHMALVHGPVYIGDNCFIGFRTTVFNARVGHGCIVMMHALIQDVEIPPGKYVPSGAIITTQHQADRLPDVQDRDRQFVQHIVGTGVREPLQGASSAGHRVNTSGTGASPAGAYGSPAESVATSGQPENISSQSRGGTFTMDVAGQVRQLLRQGYRVGLEYANKRRFQTSSWNTAAPIHSNRESDVMRAINETLAEFQGQYVRLVGTDPNAKKRVLEVIIQRPDGPVTEVAAPKGGYASVPVNSRPSKSASYGNGSLQPEVVSQVKNLLNQGFRIGTEHASKRHFRTSSWATCEPIQSNRESEVLSALEGCLKEHSGEYVRLIGINTHQRQRVLEMIIQRPDGNQTPTLTSSGAGAATPAPAPTASYSSNGSAASYQSTSTNGSGALGSDVVAQVRSLLAQGYKIGAEHADKRRFRTSSWNSCAPIQSKRDGEVIAALERCLAEHPNEYVRLIGIDPQVKRRVAETMIQKAN